MPESTSIKKQGMEAVIEALFSDLERPAWKSELVQRLWSGYGELLRVRATGTLKGGIGGDEQKPPIIVKNVRPPRAGSKVKDNVSHQRKLTSYQVELAFYRHYAYELDPKRCKVPTLFWAAPGPGEAGINDNETWLVLEDLVHAGYSE